MDGIHDENGTVGSQSVGTAARWHDGPSVKQRTAVEHLVRDLLDQLAPERPPARANQPAPTVQRLRSPRRCILQATGSAVSVSWFPGPDEDAPLGELRVIEWRGVVARPGSANRATGQAVPLSEVVLRPVAVDDATWGWRADDGVVCDTATLAARCRALVASGVAPAVVAPAAVAPAVVALADRRETSARGHWPGV